MLANAWTSLGAARLAAVQPGDLTAVRIAHQDAQVALTEKPGFVRALMLAARTSMLLGLYEESRRHVALIEEASPGYAPALLHRAWLHAIADPANPYHDPAAARALLEALRAAARSDPSLERGVHDLERALGN
jgi:hypothetical protein